MVSRLACNVMIMITLRSLQLLGQYHNFHGYYIEQVIILFYVDCFYILLFRLSVANRLYPFTSLTPTMSLEPCDCYIIRCLGWVGLGWLGLCDNWPPIIVNRIIVRDIGSPGPCPVLSWPVEPQCPSQLGSQCVLTPNFIKAQITKASGSQTSLTKGISGHMAGWLCHKQKIDIRGGALPLQLNFQ